MGRFTAIVVVGVTTALALGACAGGEVADEESSPSGSDPPATTVSLDSTTTAPLPATTTTTTAETTIPVEVADAAIAVVLSALDAKNSFDLDGWLMALEGGQRRGVPLHAEETLMNAEERWEVVEPCQVTGETTSGDTVVGCLIQEITTSYWGVGGISYTKALRFGVNTDGLITTSNHFGQPSKNAFNQAFHQWLSDTYPEVYSEMDPGYISGNMPGFDTRNPDHMLVAVEYVEEFVAQSDTYPLDPTDQ